MNTTSHIMLYYKGDISALTLFCQFEDGGICYPPLPKLSSILDAGDVQPEVMDLDGTKLIKQINELWGLDDELVVPEPGFYQQIETAKGIATVYLARFKILDPPNEIVLQNNAKLLRLTELVGRLPTEMELLRRAYTVLMEG
ncbi:hypothetical protein [Methylophaga sp.]|uniref:hypothetical protein n=1 Tax=Methylophaga sp. TaxID=2024840 RepID=UPI002728DB24|nr:hypothetical protein [Methylophaga sp.]MDO8828094.1 hypothetical protein [Methylophaga sp.]